MEKLPLLHQRRMLLTSQNILVKVWILISQICYPKLEFLEEPSNLKILSQDSPSDKHRDFLRIHLQLWPVSRIADNSSPSTFWVEMLFAFIRQAMLFSTNVFHPQGTADVLTNFLCNMEPQNSPFSCYPFKPGKSKLQCLNSLSPSFTQWAKK